MKRWASAVVLGVLVLSGCHEATTDLLDARPRTALGIMDEARMAHTGGPGGKPRAWTGGKEVEFSGWPVFDSPALSLPLRSGQLRIGAGEGSRLLKFPGSIAGDPSDAAAAQDH